MYRYKIQAKKKYWNYLRAAWIHRVCFPTVRRRVIVETYSRRSITNMRCHPALSVKTQAPSITCCFVKIVDRRKGSIIPSCKGVHTLLHDDIVYFMRTRFLLQSVIDISIKLPIPNPIYKIRQSSIFFHFANVCE